MTISDPGSNRMFGAFAPNCTSSRDAPAPIPAPIAAPLPPPNKPPRSAPAPDPIASLPRLFFFSIRVPSSSTSALPWEFTKPFTSAVMGVDSPSCGTRVWKVNSNVDLPLNLLPLLDSRISPSMVAPAYSSGATTSALILSPFWLVSVEMGASRRTRNSESLVRSLASVSGASGSKANNSKEMVV